MGDVEQNCSEEHIEHMFDIFSISMSGSVHSLLSPRTGRQLEVKRNWVDLHITCLYMPIYNISSLRSNCACIYSYLHAHITYYKYVKCKSLLTQDSPIITYSGNFCSPFHTFESARTRRHGCFFASNCTAEKWKCEDRDPSVEHGLSL